MTRGDVDFCHSGQDVLRNRLTSQRKKLDDLSSVACCPCIIEK